NDPAVTTQTFWYRTTDGTRIYAYQAWPANAQMNHSLPGIVVIHANEGLVEHFMDMARRFAVQGYVAIAPDFVSRNGTPALQLSSDEQRAGYASLNSAAFGLDALGALDALKAHPSVDVTKLAATGYCAGGSVTWQL